MIKQKKLKDILLKGWKMYDGSDVYDVPARDFRFSDRKNGCLIITEEGVSIFKTFLHYLYKAEDIQQYSVDFVEKPTKENRKLLTRNNQIPPEIADEVIEMYKRYTNKKENLA